MDCTLSDSTRTLRALGELSLFLTVPITVAVLAPRFPPCGPAVSFPFSNKPGVARATEGWEFQTTAAVTVSALGVYDHHADGLDFAIPVGCTTRRYARRIGHGPGRYRRTGCATGIATSASARSCSGRDRRSVAR